VFCVSNLDSMFELVVSSLYFILPVYFANMCPVLFAKAGFPLGVPVSERWFGKNKTWRGLYAGFFGALLIIALQRYLQNIGLFDSYRIIDYMEVNLFLYSFLFGVGSVMGDLIESFFKRRLKIAPGRPFFPFDQIDFVLGAYIFLLPVYILDGRVLVVLLLITPLLHFLTNVIAYFVGLQKEWW